MRIKSLVLLVCTFILCTQACVAENVVKENRETETFRKISAGWGIDVYFTQNNSQSVQVEADKDYIDKIITKVEGETLVIKMEDNSGKKIINFHVARTMNVYVSAPVLDEVSISGGSDFYTDNLKCSNSFKLSASGGADAKIGELQVAENVAISTSGGSDANIKSLTGVKNTDISASGGADCDIKNLQTAECKLSANGGSDININIDVSGKLAASASGGADIKLSGKANDVSASASGGSDIDVRNVTYKTIDAHKSGGSDIHKN